MDLVTLNGKTIEFEKCFNDMTVYLTNKLIKKYGYSLETKQRQEFLDNYAKMHQEFYGTQFIL